MTRTYNHMTMQFLSTSGEMFNHPSWNQPWHRLHCFIHSFLLCLLRQTQCTAHTWHFLMPPLWSGVSSTSGSGVICLAAKHSAKCVCIAVSCWQTVGSRLSVIGTSLLDLHHHAFYGYPPLHGMYYVVQSTVDIEVEEYSCDTGYTSIVFFNM